MADFPPPGFKKEHSKFYNMEPIPNVLEQQMEGGYKQTRARTTRRARRLFTTGWELLYQEEKKRLEDFMFSVGVTALSFTWVDPTDNDLVIVRFQERIKFDYEGLGPTGLWKAENIKLLEV